MQPWCWLWLWLLAVGFQALLFCCIQRPWSGLCTKLINVASPTYEIWAGLVGVPRPGLWVWLPSIVSGRFLAALVFGVPSCRQGRRTTVPACFTAPLCRESAHRCAILHLKSMAKCAGVLYCRQAQRPTALRCYTVAKFTCRHPLWYTTAHGGRGEATCM